MTISELLSGLDEYTRKARLGPGLVAAFPIFSFAAVFIPHEPLWTAAPVVVAASMTFMLANLVRSMGKKLEQRLVEGWDGLPTTRMLRFREPQNAVLFDWRRKALEALIGEPLPTRRQETANPARADEAYVAVTRFLIACVRDRPKDFPRVHDENISYGFARNSLGLKPLAVVAVVLVIGADCLTILLRGLTPGVAVALGVHFILLGYWLFFVKEAWVRQAGTTYAERLFETLDSPLLGKSSAAANDAAPA